MGEIEDLPVRLGNLYLAHAFAFMENRKVMSRDGEVGPDESLMRKLEWDGAIYENRVYQFRKSIVIQARNQRMDILYSCLYEVFQFFCTPTNREWEDVQMWFHKYPHIPNIPLNDIPF